jgi:hypothetical protein
MPGLANDGTVVELRQRVDELLCTHESLRG